MFTNFSSVSLSPTTSLCAATALHIKQYFIKCTGAVETIITLLYRNLFRAVVVLNPFSSCHLTSYCAFQYSNTSKHIKVQTHNVYTWQVTGHEFLKVKLCWNTNTSKHGPKRNVIGHEFSKCSVGGKGWIPGADLTIRLISFQRYCSIEWLNTIHVLIELFLVPRTLSTTLCSPSPQCVHPVDS